LVEAPGLSSKGCKTFVLLPLRYRVAVCLGKTLNAVLHLRAKQSPVGVAQPDERHANRTASVLE